MLHRIAFLLLPLLLLAACGGDKATTDSPGAEPMDRKTPEGLANLIFAAARSGDFSALAGIADPVDSDGDAKRIAAVPTAEAEDQAEFRKYFDKGRINGKVEIKDDEAKVPILFGLEGTKKETFNMVRRDGIWYLQGI